MSRPAISVLLPTIRPHLVERALSSLVAAARDVPYEAVVVADFPESALDCRAPSAHLHCQWIEHPRRGVVDAVQVACAAASGQYWFLFNDESTLDPDALWWLYREATQSTVPEVLTPAHVPTFPFRYYGRPFAAFPFVHRDIVAQLGGLLDPAFRGFYADPDFSLRAHAQGIPIRTVPKAILRHANKHDAPHAQMVTDYLTHDRAVFRHRWDHLGSFRDP